MLSRCVIVTVLFGVACARSAATDQNSIDPKTEARAADDSTSFYGDVKFVYKIYQECAAADLSSCLKMKLITAIDRVTRSYKEVPLFGGVSFVKDANPAPEPAASTQTEADLEASLPRAIGEREDALNTLIFDKVTSFLQSHTLQVRIN